MWCHLLQSLVVCGKQLLKYAGSPSLLRLSGRRFHFLHLCKGIASTIVLSASCFSSCTWLNEVGVHDTLIHISNVHKYTSVYIYIIDIYIIYMYVWSDDLMQPLQIFMYNTATIILPKIFLQKNAYTRSCVQTSKLPHSVMVEHHLY